MAATLQLRSSRLNVQVNPLAIGVFTTRPVAFRPVYSSGRSVALLPPANTVPVKAGVIYALYTGLRDPGYGILSGIPARELVTKYGCQVHGVYREPDGEVTIFASFGESLTLNSGELEILLFLSSQYETVSVTLEGAKTDGFGTDAPTTIQLREETAAPASSKKVAELSDEERAKKFDAWLAEESAKEKMTVTEGTPSTFALPVTKTPSDRM